MRRYFNGVLYILVLLALFCVLNPARAADLSQVMVRFDRMQVSTATTGLICASPATASTETEVEVIFPTAFAVSGTLSNWTVATTNIPASAVAWPGIGTASSVSSQTVTFPSGDLSTGVLYCFRWTNSAAVTTGSTVTNYNGRVTTLASGSTPIDTKQYFLRLTNNDKVVVTATVAPDSNDIDFSMTSSPTNATQLQENDEVTFTLSYRSNLSYSSPLTIDASWTKGTVSGTGNEIDIFDYVVGSATTSDEGAVPIIDLTNRTITWDISSISPSATFHTVQFKLVVRSSIPTANSVSADVQSTASINGDQLHQEALTFTIQSAVTPTPTSGPTATSAPGPSATGTPSTYTPTPTTASPVVVSPTPGVYPIENVTIVEITDTSAKISFHTDISSTYQLLYGTSPQQLNQKTENAVPGFDHLVELTELKPNTQYYFRIKTKDISGKEYNSDIFTFTTASKRNIFLISSETLSITWSQLLLTGPGVKNLLIPINTPFTINLKISQPERVREITARVRHRDVLGIKETASSSPVEETRLIEILPGIFSADLQPPQASGQYSITVTIKDIYGGLYQNLLPYTVIVAAPFRVINRDTGIGIEDAHVILKKYEENSKQYTPLTEGFAFQNRTTRAGELVTALPQGKYLAEISAIGYKKESVDFKISQTTTNYPLVKLIPESSIIASIQYVSQACIDLAQYLRSVIATIFQSQKTQTLVLLLAELTLLLVTIATLSLRLHIGIFGLPRFLAESVLQTLIYKRPYLVITVARVGDLIPLSGVQVYIMDHNYHLIYKGHTNITGTLILPKTAVKPDHEPHKIFLHRKGYYAYPIVLDAMTIASAQLTAHMNSEHAELGATAEFWGWLKDSCIIVCSDALVLLTVVSTAFITYYQGIAPSIPMLGTTITLCIFWMIFIKNFWSAQIKKP